MHFTTPAPRRGEGSPANFVFQRQPESIFRPLNFTFSHDKSGSQGEGVRVGHDVRNPHNPDLMPDSLSPVQPQCSAITKCLAVPLPQHKPDQHRMSGWGPGGAAMGQAAMSALGSSRACSPRPSPTAHCMSQCPPIVRTANVLSARCPIPSHLAFYGQIRSGWGKRAGGGVCRTRTCTGMGWILARAPPPALWTTVPLGGGGGG